MSTPGNPVLSADEEIFHIAGDVDRGFTTTMSLDKKKLEVTVRYRDFLMTCDLYQVPDAPSRLILYCPKCKNVLTVPGDKKKIEFDPTRLPQFGGELNVEPFTCTWEAEPNGRRMDFGLGLCGWRVGIDNNVAKDA